MNIVYDKEGTAISCRKDQVATMVKAGFLAKAPKKKEVKLEK